jgi:hypothetical protein
MASSASNWWAGMLIAESAYLGTQAVITEFGLGFSWRLIIEAVSSSNFFAAALQDSSLLNSCMATPTKGRVSESDRTLSIAVAKYVTSNT